jgi:uncharacterized protein
MKAVFADTAHYVALLVETDEYHEAALRWELRSAHVVVTDYVLVELGNVLSSLRYRVGLPAFIRRIRSEPTSEVVPASDALLEKGLALFEQRPDKEWSLTDCISFVVMREHGLTDAMTSDRHFEQAGFRALLRESG